MSCSGCRVLRKGCRREECMLRECLEWIENPQAQGHATLFVAKFFGRATLMSFLSSVPSNHRSAMFRSLVYEAVGRSINPISGAVGLLWTGNWQLCQIGVDKVLEGEAPLTPLPPHILEDSFAFQSQQQQEGALNVENLRGSAEEGAVDFVDSGTGRCEQQDHDIEKQSHSATPTKLLTLFHDNQ